MQELLGKITASLVESDKVVPENLIDKINANIKPPAKVTADDVHIRAMYIVSDQVNSYGGRFPVDEHERLAEFLVDSPVLIGHRKDSLPIARNFHAETLHRDGANWIKVYFYWLKNAEHGENLRKNIDAGIYKECSISFVFSLPECSICGSDIRQCRHRPFEKYKTDSGETVQAHFNYRQIAKVLETSLVYRGSVSDTLITDQLFFGCENNAEEKVFSGRPQFKPFQRLWDINRLDKGSNYIVLPAYESLRLIVSRSNNKTLIAASDGQGVESKTLNKYIHTLKFPEGDYSVDCRLVGYCGKERRTVGAIRSYLNGEESSVRRLEIKIADLIAVDGEDAAVLSGIERRRKLEKLFADTPELLIPAKEAQGEKLAQIVGKCITRYGVEIFECNSSGRYLLTSKKYLPAIITGRSKAGDGYRYSMECHINNELKMPVETVYSTGKIDPGDTAELETYAVNCPNEKISLSQPRIVDVSGCHGQPDNISLLLDDNSSVDERPVYTLCEKSNGVKIMVIQNGSDLSAYRLFRFDVDLLEGGSLFFADRIENYKQADDKRAGGGAISEVICRDDSMRLHLDGFLTGHYMIRPVLKDGIRRYVFYKIKTNEIANPQNKKSGR